MSIQVNKGAVKFHSIRDMAVALAAKTNEPVQRAYIRLYKRIEAGMTPSQAFHAKPRKYTRKEIN